MNLGAPHGEGYTWVFALWLVPQGAVFEFSFHPIHSIALKFTIDKHTESMVPFRVLSRTTLAGSSPSTSFASSISFISFRLRTLKLSCRSFSHPDPLFSTTSALFLQNTRGGCPNTSAPSFASAVTCATWRLYPLWPQSIAHTSCHHGGVPLGALLRCTEAQKCLFVSPLLATLTHSVSRKSFPCHSYANTRDMGVTAPNFFLPFTPIFEGPPLTSARSVSCSVPLCLCGNFQSCPASVLRRDEPISSIFDGSRISFRINTYKSVSKQTTSTPFRINTCEKHREGEGYC